VVNPSGGLISKGHPLAAGIGAVFAAGAISDSGHDLFDPSNISPLAAYLASVDCHVTGRVFAVQGGAFRS
jgi:acetyl-CoA acetyltransferase